MSLKGMIVKKIETESVAFFGAGRSVPNIVSAKESGRLEIFRSKKRKQPVGLEIGCKELNSLSDISRRGANTCFLDNEAIKVLIAKYPNYAQIVLVRVRPSPTFILGLVGLARRVLKNMVLVRGLVFLDDNPSGKSCWLVLENCSSQVDEPIYLSLSKEVGVQGLINFLNEKNVNYVVPRFFESFPELHRDQGGDVDILVSDADAAKVRAFLRQNPGRIPVDLHTVSGPAPGSGGMPYFPPRLALHMLDNHISGPINARVPNPADYLHSFLYHILFHKGLFSGVVSESFPDSSNTKPENNYGEFARNLADKVDIELELTLEALERVLADAGWVPKLDTLAAIARLNTWVRWHYFDSREILEIGLSVVILKTIARKNNWIDSIEKDFELQDFEILCHKTFTDTEQAEMSKILRGGNWHSSTGNLEDYLPHSVYILLDKRHKSPTTAMPGRKEARVRMLKTYLRQKYDPSLDSFIHATDDTDQSWEYIRDIYADETPAIKELISQKVGQTPQSKKDMLVQFKIWSHVIKERIKARVLADFD